MVYHRSIIGKTNVKFGRIDVITNNIGYGISGAVKELSEQEITANFNIIFFCCSKSNPTGVPLFIPLSWITLHAILADLKNQTKS